MSTLQSRVNNMCERISAASAALKYSGVVKVVGESSRPVDRNCGSKTVLERVVRVYVFDSRKTSSMSDQTRSIGVGKTTPQG